MMDWADGSQPVCQAVGGWKMGSRLIVKVS